MQLCLIGCLEVNFSLSFTSKLAYQCMRKAPFTYVVSFKSFTNFPNFPASLIQNNWYYYPMDKSLSNGQHSMPERYLSVEWHFPPLTQLDLRVQLYLKIYLTNKIRGTYRSQSQCILMQGSCFANSLIRKIYT